MPSSTCQLIRVTVDASSCFTFSKTASSPTEGRKLRWVQGVELPQFGPTIDLTRNCVRSRFQWLYSHKTESASAWQPGPRDLLPLGGRHFTGARLLTLAIWTLADTLPVSPVSSYSLEQRVSLASHCDPKFLAVDLSAVNFKEGPGTPQVVFSSHYATCTLAEASLRIQGPSEVLQILRVHLDGSSTRAVNIRDEKERYS